MFSAPSFLPRVALHQWLSGARAMARLGPDLDNREHIARQN
jgi:hypothetical protein